MKTIYLVEYGSNFRPEDWEIICAFSMKEAAEAFKKSKGEISSSLYHITPVKLDPMIKGDKNDG